MKEKIDLSGIWKFEMASCECAKKFHEVVKLPGTMDENKKGIDNISNVSRIHLNRDYTYVGKATYQREIVIPLEWMGRNIQLFLERTRKTRVWIDGKEIGKGQQKSYVTPHRYDLSKYVKGGEHYILTIEVDNSPQDLPHAMYTTFEKHVPWGHMNSEHTQTNWNGILGEICLISFPEIRIKTFQIRPDVDKNTAHVFMQITRDPSKDNIEGIVDLQAESYNHDTDPDKVPIQSFPFFMGKDEDSIELQIEYQMGKDTLLWDEFQPTMYKMTATLRSRVDDKKLYEEKESFGMRKFEALYTESGGKQFAINGRATQLRGEINCAVFPLTGYPPMDLPAWMRVMRIYKDYGMNHVRFHTWVPPKAAFEAADLVGLYIQFELPQWGHKMFGDIDKGDTTDADYYWDETVRIFRYYLNSPSAVMMALGNELRPGFYYYDIFLERCKKVEPELLYTDIAGWSAYSKNVDFSGSVPTKGKDFLHRIEPMTDWDHWDNTRKTPVPFLAHEVGQLQTYPDYEKDIEKYHARNALMKPRNLESYEEILRSSPIGDMAERFHRSTVELSFHLYRYMIESYLRTPGAGGFQLLGLQDFPGQGTALIGILDAFLDRKVTIVPEKFRRSCAELTVMARFPRFTWKNDMEFTADIVIANYSAADIGSSVSWKMMTQDGAEVRRGVLKRTKAVQGEVTFMGRIRASLADIKKPEKIMLCLAIDEMDHKQAPYSPGINAYPFWIYPADEQKEKGEMVSVYRQFTKGAEEDLKKGKNVLIISKGSKAYLPKSRAMTFRPDFWSPMFHQPDHDGHMLGCLINEKHPIFQDFPTDDFADWQWFDLIQGGRSIQIDRTPTELDLIVQAIPTIDMGERLGVLFEAKVGKGKLLVSSINLLEDPSVSARQLLYSIKKYMGSEQFAPKAELDIDFLKDILPEHIQTESQNISVLPEKKENIPADKEEFFRVLAEAGEKKKEDYTAGSWEGFEEIYRTAVSFGALTNATQEEVDAMLEQLQKSMDALRKWEQGQNIG